MLESARSASGRQRAGDAKLSPKASARRAEATDQAPWVALLEDDEDQGALLCHWIRPLLEGRELHWFRRVDELLDHLTTTPHGAPCLLLCDYELEDGDALSVMQRIAAYRGSSERPCEGADEDADGAAAVSVVVVSAHTDPARREAVLGAGAAAWLTKPVSRGDVQRTVTEIVDAREGEQEADSSRS